ncbi:hypothetical protein [Methyloterricola oryzae]|uniref:hypothetical protein n=1 Tax=Methyloterricola oryzae TaxID=1495050 RepID=UPI0011AF8181|nr:hypothetical protein [Methyloterricola oryzae]
MIPMNMNPRPQSEARQVSLVVSFEGVHGILVEIQAYMFDATGTLMARAPVRKSRAVFSLSDDLEKQVYVVIAPPVDEAVDGPVTLAKIRAFHGFEVQTRLDPLLKSHFLPEVPEAVWRWWLVHCLWPGLNRRSDWQSSAALIL